MYSHNTFETRIASFLGAAIVLLGSAQDLEAQVPAAQRSPITVASVTFRKVPDELRVTDQVVFYADPGSLRGGTLRARAFRGTKAELASRGISIVTAQGNCVLYGAKVIPVRGVGGTLTLGFVNDDWLGVNSAGVKIDERWVLVFELEGGEQDGWIVLPEGEAGSYFASGTEVVVTARGYVQPVNPPISKSAGAATGSPEQILKVIGCSRLQRPANGDVINALTIESMQCE